MPVTVSACVSAVSAAVTEHTVGSAAQEVTGGHGSQFRKLPSPRPRPQQVRSGEGSAPWLVTAFPLEPHAAGGAGSSWVSLARALVPVTLPRPHLPTPSHGGGVQRRNLGDTHI